MSFGKASCKDGAADYPGVLSGLSGVPTIIPKLKATRKKAPNAHTNVANHIAINQYVDGVEALTFGAATKRGREKIVSAKPPKHARLV
jgi:hypothetical protein